MTGRIHAAGWDDLSREVQAAIDRTLAKVRPVGDLDPEHVRRLALLLGLRRAGTHETHDRAGGDPHA